MLGFGPSAIATPSDTDGVKVSKATMRWLKDDGTARKATGKPLTPEQVKQEARRRGATYIAEADEHTSARSPRLLANEYDYINPQECRDNESKSGKPGGWVKNHFAWCGRLAVTHEAKTCDPNNPEICRVDGKLEVVYTIIGYGEHTQANDRPSKTERGMSFAIWVDELRVRTGPYANDASTLYMSVACVTQDAPRNCYSSGAGGTERTLGQWEIQKDSYVELISPGKAPSKANGEQFIHADILSVSVGEAAGGYPPSRIERPGTSIRFDSMPYNGTATRGSIFTVVDPFLRFNRASNSGYKEVAEHLWTALNRPQDTKPPFTDKELPGKNIGNPLHRLVSSYSDANKKRVDANRYYAKAWGCDPYFPGWNSTIIYPPEYPEGTPSHECDEYPFASTHEGAARWQHDGPQYQNMFSARPVFWRDNRAAGNVLLNWYNWDRIANKGEYYIKVE
ncbi:hypothetical protein GCM10010182_82450 [Actinomadura cremea]|nr:hypothetical protein GCM10010182_82450 [Actinomadura cremea]